MGPAGPVLSGRAEERARLLAAVREGLSGEPRTVLVRGEAGIGKTALARDVCAEVETEGVQVLWGQCLRLAAVEAMFHPVVLALEGWLRTKDAIARAELVAAVPAAAMVLPSLGGRQAVPASGLMLLVDSLIEHVVALEATVLVVDDVHWADAATWDAVSYLVAGMRDQRLAVVMTYRDEAVVSAVFQRWLEHLRRLPRTEDLALGRLDRTATEQQVSGLLDREASLHLAAQVFERSGGNPYLSELLARRLAPGGSRLPDHLPEDLSNALLDAWRGLSGPAREVTRILAVAGRPSDVRTLDQVAPDLAPVVSHVREALDDGVLVIDDDLVWFRHPLLAAVLLESSLPGENDAVHAAWARQLASTTARGLAELRRLGDLAHHHEQAGDRAAALEALLAGAAMTEALRAPREVADLLQRAVALWNHGAHADDRLAHAMLLRRTARALAWVDRQAEGVTLMRHARDLLLAGDDPVLAGHLVAHTVGYSWPDVTSADEALAELDRAVQLTALAPDGPEHADAWVTKAFVLFWSHRPDECRAALARGIRAAEAAGSAAALSGALQVRCYLAVAGGDLVEADALAEASWRHALASGDDVAMWESASARYMAAHSSGDLRRLLEVVRVQADWSFSRGLVLGPTCDLTDVFLALGDLRSAADAARRGLTGTGGAIDEADLRVLVALLSVRQGREGVAREHFARALEVLPDLLERPFAVRATAVADLLIALGDRQQVLATYERALPRIALDPRFPDALLVRCATAVADLVQEADDRRDRVAARRWPDELDRLRSLRDELVDVPAFHPSNPRDTQQSALAALWSAQVARARSEQTMDLWRAAADACAAAGMEWEQRSAELHLAGLRVEAGSPAREVADLLRSVCRYAADQGAVPMVERAEELAKSARVSLAEPVAIVPDTVPAPFAGLTARESEVLGHLVAHRTYAEIAAALFISEKTVSVHVSNLLRKTQTSSRREVSALARRVGFVSAAE